MRTLLLLVLGAVAVAAVPKNPQRIVGGSTTNVSNYPYIASLLYSRNSNTYWQSCGGTVINYRTILTAAHCTFGDSAGQWRIRVGSTYANSGGTVLATNRILNHPNYNTRTNDNDVALLRSQSNINLGGIVQAGVIAGSNYYLPDNAQVWAAGWGTTSFLGQSSEQLRHVQIWTVNQSTCRNRYAQLGYSVTDNMLCSGWLDVGGRDQCQGDSGGPLVHNNVIVGVCSWGHECARAQYPGVNARVSRYTSWIQNNA
ncbi:trypsin, alkaline C-like precursor [Plutella xylostella]|uniref:Serine protease n=1 Tax=Plutella xylostella TaxID=51655 RepID=S5PVP1_PLUXY|nr:trypsin, alkaline C-like precursor [Plutella xylostella]AGR92345.1 serine protease [Plutella xylostella]